MPIYEITHPTTGMTLEFEGATPPSKAIIDAAFVRVGSKPALSPREQFIQDQQPETTQNYPMAEHTDTSILGKINKGLGYVAENIGSEVPRLAAEAITVPLNSLKKAAYGISGIARMGESAISDLKDLRIPDTNKALQAGAERMQDFTPVQSPLQPSMVGTGISKLAEMGTNAAENATGNTGFAKAGIEAGMDIAGLVGGVKGAQMIKKGITPYRTITPEVAAPRISIDYQKAIRPSVKGTAGSAKQLNKSDANAIQGVFDVVEAKNKGVLKLGEDQVSRLPETLQEHLDSVAQARIDAFNEYNQMQRQATGNGVTISGDSVANTLRQAATDESLALTSPEVISYMEDVASRFEGKQLTPEVVQDTIAKLNTKIDYSKVAPDIANRDMVNKSVAAQLRELQNQAIESDGNPNYQAIRQKYGRLAQMEKEAAHRARVAGRAAPSSLFDGVMGGLTSSEIVTGLLTANPAMISKGAIMAAYRSFRNKLNSPDYQIKRMYKTADKVGVI